MLNELKVLVFYCLNVGWWVIDCIKLYYFEFKNERLSGSLFLQPQHGSIYCNSKS